MKKKTLIRTLCIAVPALLLLCLAGVVWCSFEQPEPLKKPVLTQADFFNQFQILQQLMRFFSKKDLPETYELKLTPEQLNSLIKTGGVFRTKNFTLQAYDLTADADGWLRFRYGHDTQKRWLNGGILPLSGMVNLVKKGEELDVSFRSLSAGLIPLPRSAGQEAFDRFLSRYGNTQEFRFAMKCIQSVSFDAGTKSYIFTLRTSLLRRML